MHRAVAASSLAALAASTALVVTAPTAAAEAVFAAPRETATTPLSVDPASTPAASTTTSTATTSTPTYGETLSVAGGGDGWSGPASFARVPGELRADVDGSGRLLVVSDQRPEVLRVDAATDRITVLPGTAGQDYTVRDVAADGTGVVLATSTGVIRITAAGTRTTLSTDTGLSRIDVGVDGVVWAASSSRVVRILPDGTVAGVTTEGGMGSVRDLAVRPDGQRAYAMDAGSERVGVYELTPGGLGPRLAGNGLRTAGGIPTGQPATAVSVESVFTLTTDGTTVWLGSRDYNAVAAVPVAGGATSVIQLARPVTLLDRLGTGFAVGGLDRPAWTWGVHRISAGGTDLGRLVGVDPDTQWSPDGVRADDAYLTNDPYLNAVRGGAALPSGLTVLTTTAGLVREVGVDGVLRTRATLGKLATGGKVALAGDGTAYVVTDDGGVMRVPSSGTPTPAVAPSGAVDVEVATDGSLLVADGPGRRLLRVTSGGTTSVVANLPATPTDLGLEGTDVLVAGSGLRRVSPGGAVTTVLTGGDFTAVAGTTEGVFLDNGMNFTGRVVLLPGGALAPMRADYDFSWQSQALGGDLLRAGLASVRLVADPGLAPQPAPIPVTATPGSGRVLLDWDGATVAGAVVRAKQGSAPVDQWDGVPVDDTHTVFHTGSALLVPGKEWIFSVFFYEAVPWHDAWPPLNLSGPVVVKAAALVDTDPPPLPPYARTWRTQTATGAQWTDPLGDDFSHSVARYLPGTDAPQTPTDGYPMRDDGAVPGAEPDVDYAISIFTIDLHGNFARWIAVTRVDIRPPAQVTDVRVTATFTRADVSVTLPTDGDFTGILFATAPGDAVPQLPPNGPSNGSTFTVWGLTMDTDYTLAVWAVDDLGNRSEPVLTRFRTPLDATPPAVVRDLAAVGGDYQVAATWVPSTEIDLATLQPVLVDLTTGKETAGPTSKTATGFTWTRLPGGRTYEVRVTATDVNGNVSNAVTARADTAPDANGAPPAIDRAAVVVTPTSSTRVSIAFARPAIPDLRTLAYAVTPLGADPDTVTSVTSIPLATPTVTATVTLPQPVTAYQLVLYVWDHNGNRARSVLPQVKGAWSAAERPWAPTALTVTTPHDNGIDVAWSTALNAVAATEWQVTVTSGDLTRTALVTGAARAAAFDDLPGRRDWAVSIVGRNAAGDGAVKTAAAVRVGDDTPPGAVTGLGASPSYDTQRLTWANPTAFDLDHVVVTRYGATASETSIVYTGRGTSATASGLLGGRSYSFVVAAYDAFGNTAPVPARVDRVQASVSMSIGKSVTYPGTTKATGTLRWNGSVLSGRTVVVQAQKAGTTTWAQAATATTSSTGSYSVSLKPSVTTRYRVAWAGSGTRGGVVGAVGTVTVAPSVSIKASRTSFALGGTATVSTVVWPSHAGRSIVLQRWTGTSWQAVATRTLSSSSTASASVKPPKRGTNSYRWVLAAHTDHGTGVSATLKLSVS